MTDILWVPRPSLKVGPSGAYQSQGLRPLLNCVHQPPNKALTSLNWCVKSGPAQYECPCLETPRSESKGPAALLVCVVIVSEKRSPPLHPGPSSSYFVKFIIIIIFN